MPKDLGDKGMVEGVDAIVHHNFTEGREPQVMSEPSYHQPNQPSSTIMFRVILNQLKTKAEELLVEEQAGFRPGRSTVGQIFNS